MELGDGKRYILLNTLNAEVAVLDEREIYLIREWDKTENIKCRNKEEKKFINQLVEKGYIVEEKQEEKIVEQYMAEGRERYTKLKNYLNGAVFVLNYDCNFRCPYCYEEAGKNRIKSRMNEKMVDKIFEIYGGSIDNISLYGGEPLLEENRTIINYIISKAPYAKYSFISNGYNLIDFYETFKKLDVVSIMITLDGKKETHNRTRYLSSGDGTFERIEQGINLYLRNGLPIKIRMNISDKNINECLELRKEYVKKYSKQYEKGLLTFELQPIFQLREENRNRLNEVIMFGEHNGKWKPSKVKDNMMFISASPLLKKFLFGAKTKFVPKYCNCTAEMNRRFFDPEGDIYTCILGVKDKRASVGTYYPQYKLKEKSMIHRNIETIKECKECKLKFLCGGGCANTIMDENGDVLFKNCSSIHNEIYNELPQIVRKYV